MYTAVGRASKFMNMNIGAIATEKMATEPSKAFSIGRIDDNSKLNKDKVDAMRLEAERLFTELATEDEAEKRCQKRR